MRLGEYGGQAELGGGTRVHGCGGVGRRLLVGRVCMGGYRMGSDGWSNLGPVACVTKKLLVFLSFSSLADPSSSALSSTCNKNSSIF